VSDFTGAEVNTVLMLVKGMSDKGDVQLSILARALAVGARSCGVDREVFQSEIMQCFDDPVKLMPLSAPRPPQAPKATFTDTESDSLEAIGYLLDRLPDHETDVDWTPLQNGTIRHLYDMAKRGRVPKAGRVNEEMVGRALAAFNKAISDPIMEKCARCDGKGYHHGFGEDGASPDWCEECGGNQYNVRPGEEARAMKEALTAALHKEG
jgi:hypothetical protein